MVWRTIFASTRSGDKPFQCCCGMRELHGREALGRLSRSQAWPACGNLETEGLKEAEECRHRAWVGQGEDREGNGQEDWVDEMLLAEAEDL